MDVEDSLALALEDAELLGVPEMLKDELGELPSDRDALAEGEIDGDTEAD